jgi:hypothetical protein
VTRIGLTLGEHFDLRVKPQAGADAAFHEAAYDEWDRKFSKATVTASHHLRSLGITAARHSGRAGSTTECHAFAAGRADGDRPGCRRSR